MVEGIMNSPYFMLMIISVAFGLIGSLVSARLKAKFKKYSMMPLSSGLTGAQVAEKMLNDYNIHDVTIQSVPGKLTDHYNPMTRTVNLSPEVYQGRSVAAAAVAAHECGHAVQHATAYAWLVLRSKLGPVVSIAASYLQYVMMGAIFLLATSFAVTGSRKCFSSCERLLLMRALLAAWTRWQFLLRVTSDKRDTHA